MTSTLAGTYSNTIQTHDKVGMAFDNSKNNNNHVSSMSLDEDQDLNEPPPPNNSFDAGIKPQATKEKDSLDIYADDDEQLIQDVRKWGGMEVRLSNLFNGRGRTVRFSDVPKPPKATPEKETDAWLLQTVPPEISNRDLLERFQHWQKRLLDDTDTDNDPDVYKRIRKFFGVHDAATDITNTIEIDYNDCSSALESLHGMMVARGLAKPDTKVVVVRERHQAIEAMRENLAQAYQIHIGLAKIRCRSNPKKLAEIPQGTQSAVENLNGKGYDDFHKLFVFLLKQFSKRNYRRCGGDVYVQQLNSRKQFASCWQRKSTIRKAIYECINPRYMYERFFVFLRSSC